MLLAFLPNSYVASKLLWRRRHRAPSCLSSSMTSWVFNCSVTGELLFVLDVRLGKMFEFSRDGREKDVEVHRPGIIFSFVYIPIGHAEKFQAKKNSWKIYTSVHSTGQTVNVHALKRHETWSLFSTRRKVLLVSFKVKVAFVHDREFKNWGRGNGSNLMINLEFFSSSIREYTFRRHGPRKTSRTCATEITGLAKLRLGWWSRKYVK